MTEKARKLFIVSTLVDTPYAASEALWHELAMSSRRSGWTVAASVSATARRSRQADELQSAGVQLHFRHYFGSGAVKRHLHRLQDYSIGPWLIRNQVPKTSDLVCVNLGALICAADAPIYGFLANLDVPYVLIVHSNPEINQYSRKIADRLRVVLQRSARTFFVSQRMHDSVRYQILLELENAAIAKNPVNLKSTVMLGWPIDETLRLAVVGRLDGWLKGQVRLLEVLSQEKWRKRDWSLSFFGEGPDRDTIAQAISFYGLEGRACLKGHVSDVAGEIWAQHHVLVMPSLFEGMSLAMVEAMLCGRVVVASDVGGASELITHGESGFLAGSPFPRQLDEALECLWKNRANLPTIGAAAHKVAALYVPQDAGRLLFDDLNRIIEKGGIQK